MGLCSHNKTLSVYKRIISVCRLRRRNRRIWREELSLSISLHSNALYLIYERAVFIICPILVAWNTMVSHEGSVCKCGHKQSQHWTVSRLYRYHTPCSVARCNCLSFIDSKEGKVWIISNFSFNHKRLEQVSLRSYSYILIKYRSS